MSAEPALLVIGGRMIVTGNLRMDTERMYGVWLTEYRARTVGKFLRDKTTQGEGRRRLTTELPGLHRASAEVVCRRAYCANEWKCGIMRVEEGGRVGYRRA